MKILYVIPHLDNGGAEVAFIKTLNMMDILQPNVLLLKRDGNLLKESHIDKKKIHKCYQKNYFKCLLTLRRYDKIISRVWFANIFILIFKKRKQKAIIFEDSVPSELAKKVSYGYLKLNIIKYLYKSSDRIIAVSDIVKTDLINLGIQENKIVVIGNPININRNTINLQNTNNRINIAYIGSFKKFKGYNFLLDIMNNLSSEINHKINIHFFGGLVKSKNIVNFIKNDGKIYSYNTIDNNKIPYDKLDIIIIPSLVQESFCNVLHEALVHNKIILATPLATPYQDNSSFKKLFISEITIESFTSSIEYLISNFKDIQNTHENSDVDIINNHTIRERLINVIRET